MSTLLRRLPHRLSEERYQTIRTRKIVPKPSHASLPMRKSNIALETLGKSITTPIMATRIASQRAHRCRQPETEGDGPAQTRLRRNM